MLIVIILSTITTIQSCSTRYSYLCLSSTGVQISSTRTHTPKPCSRTCTRTRLLGTRTWTVSTRICRTSTSLEPLVFIFRVFTHTFNYGVIVQTNATRFYVILVRALSV